MKKIVYSVIVAIYLLLFLIAFINKNEGINWVIVVAAILISHIISAIKVINPKEQGISVFLGKLLDDLDSGPHFIPFPFGLITAPKNAIKVDFGTLEEDDMERKMVSDKSESWFIMRESIRISWGDINSSGLSSDEIKQYQNDPFAKRLTTDPHLYFIFKVYSLRDLIQEAGGLQEAIDRIKDTCVTVLSQEAGKTFLAKAVKEIDNISKKIQIDVEDLVGDPDAKKRGKSNPSWGVNIQEVRIQSLGIPHRTNEAIADRTADIARADGQKTAAELKADGDAYSTKKNADANKYKSEEEGKGIASALEAKGKALADPGSQLIAKLEALETGLKAGKTVVLPTNMSILTDIFNIKESIDAASKNGGEK